MTKNETYIKDRNCSLITTSLSCILVVSKVEDFSRSHKVTYNVNKAIFRRLVYSVLLTSKITNGRICWRRPRNAFNGTQIASRMQKFNPDELLISYLAANLNCFRRGTGRLRYRKQPPAIYPIRR